jgi:hypothetical protein
MNDSKGGIGWEASFESSSLLGPESHRSEGYPIPPSPQLIHRPLRREQDFVPFGKEERLKPGIRASLIEIPDVT